MNISDLYNLFKKCGGVSTDTRSIKKGTLFFAIKGSSFDGNFFAEEALKKGAIGAVVDNPIIAKKDSRFVYVSNVLDTLQELAYYYRNKLNIPLLAITGSNGKTTSKELIASVLSQSYKITYTKGNLNNHIGVPLSILEIKDDTQIAIIEMGANHIGEIETLCNIANPTHGYITNFGKAHLEGFGGIEGVIKGKKELYNFLIKNEGIIFFNTNDSKQVKILKDYNKTFSFGTSTGHCLGQSSNRKGTPLSITVDGTTLNSHLIGNYNFTNIMASVAIGQHFEVPMSAIKKGIEGYLPKNNRSQQIKTINNRIILDAYNANPSSMEVAIENLSYLESPFVILGDMLELGNTSLNEHQKIINYLEKLGISGYLVGRYFKSIETNKGFKKIEDLDNLISLLKKHPLRNKTILIKGSRKMSLEKILSYL